jgi:hypothetical protein
MIYNIYKLEIPKPTATYHIVPQFQLQSLQLPMTNLLYDD